MAVSGVAAAASTESLRDFTISRDRVTFTGVSLGNGAYGKVSEVDFDGKLCAAKEIHSLLLELADTTEAAAIRDSFLRECYLWSTLRHPNVVSFLGIYYPSSDAESGLPILVMEKMQESVTSLVEKHSSIPLSIKLSILHDVSLGLRYLHAYNPPVIHRDLSSNNILVSSHLEAKVTDLGVAKAIMDQNSKTLTKTPGTAVFMPPEALDIKPLYGPPLDIFSFGGVVLHLTSKQWPIPKSWSQIDPVTRKRKSLSEVERRQQYIDMMTGDDAELKPLVLSCLEDDPELRPSAIDVSERLKRIIEECRSYDMMDPLSWLASNARHQQVSK